MEMFAIARLKVGLYERESNGISKYRNSAANQLYWNLQVLEFEG